ncbi:MAG: cytosine deaminase [Mycolicibacterium sp.]|nr:cytosine deaminase [Mycolicibacterium sp.]
MTIISAGQQLSTLANATLADGSTVDVSLGREAGHAVITAVRPACGAGPGDDSGVLDLAGFVLLTAPAEPHAHLDKALSWDELRPEPGDLHHAIATWKEGSLRFDEESFRTRARTAALTLLRNGTTAVRTHVDVLYGDDPLRGIRAVDAVRRELRGVMDIQIVALIKAYSDVELLHGALDAGADLVGGSPHSAPEPLAELDRLLGVAEDRGVGADLHTDEFLVGDHHTLPGYAARVRDWPADRHRTASHCTRLSMMTPAELDDLLPHIVSARLGVVANPLTNLSIHGRDIETATPRGIAPLARLRAAGVPVAAGADNVRDPFNPLGRSDALETAMLAVVAGHVDPDVALALVTDDARAVLGLPTAGPRVGARAELLAVRGTGVTDVIANAPADRIVFHDGVVVSRSETHTWMAV